MLLPDCQLTTGPLAINHVTSLTSSKQLLLAIPPRADSKGSKVLRESRRQRWVGNVGAGVLPLPLGPLPSTLCVRSGRPNVTKRVVYARPLAPTVYDVQFSCIRKNGSNFQQHAEDTTAHQLQLTDSSSSPETKHATGMTSCERWTFVI